MGFEPTNAINVTAFPMLRLRPLGHLSVHKQVILYFNFLELSSFFEKNLKGFGCIYLDFFIHKLRKYLVVRPDMPLSKIYFQ